MLSEQWLPTRQELKRRRYKQKGRDGFDHPYLIGVPNAQRDYPMGNIGPEESIYTNTIGATTRKGEPLDMKERMLRAKMRDNFQCQRCGSKENLRVHHIKGMKSHRLKDLETLCQSCHHAEHRSSHK